MANVIDILKTLLDNSNVQQQEKLASDDKQLQTRNAYQKGIDSVLNKTGEAHASEAIQQGVNPQDIANHPIMNQQSDPTQVLRNLINSDQSQVPQTPAGDIRPIIITGNDSTQTPVKQPQLSIDDQISQINKQAALNVANRNLTASNPPGFLQKFSQNLSKMEGGITPNDQIQNLQGIQKISASEPLQPKDIADFTAGTYKAGLEATHQALAVEGQKFNNLQDLYGKLNETKGRINQALAAPSEEQKTVYKALQTTAKNINTHVANLGTLINNRPKFSSTGISSQAQDTANKIKDGQTATNPKTGQTIVYKGGKWLNQ